MKLLLIVSIGEIPETADPSTEANTKGSVQTISYSIVDET
jgi:hypothetical protein